MTSDTSATDGGPAAMEVNLLQSKGKGKKGKGSDKGKGKQKGYAGDKGKSKGKSKGKGYDSGKGKGLNKGQSKGQQKRLWWFTTAEVQDRLQHLCLLWEERALAT